MIEIIEIGEYIRTKNGLITRLIKKFDKDEAMYLFGNYGIVKGNIYGLDQVLLSQKTLTECKHSFNIINLIEKGDLVNNQQVKQIFIDPFTKKKRLLIEGTEVNYQGDRSSIYCEENEIKTILTKELLKKLEFKLN